MAQSSVGPAPVLTSRARQQRSHTGPSLSRCVLVCLSILGQGWKPAISVEQVRFRGFRDALRTHSSLALRYYASRLCRSIRCVNQSAARNGFCTLLVAQILLGLQERLDNPSPNSPANQPANQLFTYPKPTKTHTQTRARTQHARACARPRNRPLRRTSLGRV